MFTAPHIIFHHNLFWQVHKVTLISPEVNSTKGFYLDNCYHWEKIGRKSVTIKGSTFRDNFLSLETSQPGFKVDTLT